MEVITAQAAVAFLGGLSCLALAGGVMATPPRGRLQVTFAMGMVGLGARAFAILILFLSSGNPLRQEASLRAILAAGLALVPPWALFILALTSSWATQSRGPWFGAGLGAGAAVLLVALVPSVEISTSPGPFLAAHLTPLGRYGVIAELLAIVGILGGLEVCLRTSGRPVRWRLKYLLLGLSGIFLVRFYFSANLLLSNTMLPDYLTIENATLFVANVVIAFSLARNRLLGVEVTVSRHVLFRSVVVAVLACYLLVIGLLGWLLAALGIAEKLFWTSVMIFVSALALAALLLSEDVRWRVKRLLGRHFYRSKYDYRDQWMTFTKRLSSLVALDELAPQLVAAVTEAIGATKAALYLVDAHDGHYHLASALGVAPVAPTMEPDSSLCRLLKNGRPHPLAPARPDDSVEPAYAVRPFPEATVAVPLFWSGRLTGFMVVGPERTGVPYTIEDYDFLATVGEQAAGAVATTSLSEDLARSRQFAALHRFTSFVIHDIKNAVSALSLLSGNALTNFDNPEFRRDAIATLSKTVERMQGLLAKLTPMSALAGQVAFRPIDLAELLVETANSFRVNKRVTLVTNINPVPAILGDRTALERAFLNFLTNAAQALDGAQGQITLRTEYREGLVTCTVQDTGRGMSAEFMRKSLFVPFRSTKSGGWGIGLYQAREIMSAHHGRLDVASEVGRGTTITARFPPMGSGPSPRDTRE